MDKKKIYRILLETLVVFFLIAILVFFVGFRVKKVQVEGNAYYSDDEIKEMVLDAPNAKHTILAMLIKTDEKTKDAKMIDDVLLYRKDRNTLIVQVKEKQMVGSIKVDGKYVNFDRQGIIQIITKKPMEGVPLIDGINVKEAKQGQKLKGINTKRLNTILSVGKMLEKSKEKPDRLVFNDMNQMVLYYKDVEVRLGDDENMDEKMNRLSGILPKLDGMEGILHLENITENTTGVVFDNVTVDSEQSKDETNDNDATTQNQTSPPPGAYYPGLTQQEDQNKDSQDEELDNSELEYTDGEDAAESKKDTKDTQ